ncbi:HDOD domain-containing protein [Azonexus sp.]|uniref:HDOD domain-containing protein n=1 Tax=Azonexus sp. TaxID=1872668 RepID=UPI0027B9FB76|nr:HDOD domain-containing protein [Azonexus sp.]
MERIEALTLIAEQASNGELAFPTGLDNSLKILRQLDDPDCHIERAVQLIKSEPLIAARVVSVANSAAYNRSGREITELHSAISRIGLRTTRTLTMAITTRQMAGSPKSAELREATAKLWDHTAHVAALCHVIARRITHLDPETAFFAGIVHEIGGFYLISRAADFPGLLKGDPADWAEQAEPTIGRAILKRLDIPESTTRAIESMWEGLLALPPVSLGDTLLLANELSTAKSPLYEADSLTTGSATGLIDSLVDDAMLSSILEDASAEVESLAAALHF